MTQLFICSACLTLHFIRLLIALMPPKKKRGAGFSLREIDSLLDVIEEHLPIGPSEWEAVERQHNSMYPDTGRNAHALRQKFAKLYLQKIPTGDPHCPLEVRRAKRIYEEIKKRTDLSDGEEGTGGEFELEQDSVCRPDKEEIDEEDGSEYWDAASEDPSHGGQSRTDASIERGEGGQVTPDQRLLMQDWRSLPLMLLSEQQQLRQPGRELQHLTT